ncbi:MAG: UbiA prenyltransferase family protein, partial [Candidatus Altiarchaeota archaeon]
LLRTNQWYKNLVIYLALFLTKGIFNWELLLKTTLGFASLCFISSSYYIINDILDLKEDRRHPEKKKRPIAAGEVENGTAFLISVIMMALSLALAYILSLKFMLFPIALMTSSMLYNLWSRKIAILDIHFIAFNFLLRAVSGTVLVDVYPTPWLIITIFFIALFLAVGKRKADLSVLDKGALKERKVYSVYDEKLLDMMIIAITAILMLTYNLYTFLAHNKPYPYMMLTIPVVSFVIFRYLYFISINDEIARDTHKVFRDKQMLVGFLLWIIISYIAVYHLTEGI